MIVLMGQGFSEEKELFSIYYALLIRY